MIPIPEHCEPCGPPVKLCEKSLTCNLTLGCRIEAVSAAVSSGMLQLTIKPFTPEAKRDYLFDVCMALPLIADTAAVIVTDGANNYSLSDINGDPILAGQLKGKSVYCVRYGNGGVAGTGTYPAHFTVKYQECHHHCGAKLPCQRR